MIKEKPNNPFKMVGSWIGAMIGLFYLPLSLLIPYFGVLYLLPIYGSCYGAFEGCDVLGLGLLFLIPMIFGFLIGWGINVLIRKARR